MPQREASNRLDGRESGPHGPLGIVLMCLGVAEIDEHPVPHVLGHKTVKPGDRLRDALVIGPDHRPQVLGVEPGREGCRADEIGEHNRELASFAVIP
jgi:hypothetical protein